MLVTTLVTWSTANPSVAKLKAALQLPSLPSGKAAENACDSGREAGAKKPEGALRIHKKPVRSEARWCGSVALYSAAMVPRKVPRWCLVRRNSGASYGVSVLPYTVS